MTADEDEECQGKTQVENEMAGRESLEEQRGMGPGETERYLQDPLSRTGRRR